MSARGKAPALFFGVLLYGADRTPTKCLCADCICGGSAGRNRTNPLRARCFSAAAISEESAVTDLKCGAEKRRKRETPALHGRKMAILFFCRDSEFCYIIRIRYRSKGSCSVPEETRAEQPESARLGKRQRSGGQSRNRPVPKKTGQNSGSFEAR